MMLALSRRHSIADLLDISFAFYRRHWFLLSGITLIIHLPLTIAQVFDLNIYLLRLVGLSGEDRVRWGTDLQVMFTLQSSLGTWITGSLLTAVLIPAIASLLHDNPSSILECYRQGLWRYVPLLVASIIPIALDTFSSIVLTFGNFFGAFPPCWLVFIGPYLLVIYLYAHVALAPQVLLLEHSSPRTSLGRSWSLVHSETRQAIGIVLITKFFGFLIAAVPVLLISSILMSIKLDPTLRNAITIGYSLMTPVIVYPLQKIILTMFYYKLRTQLEGYDIELAAHQLDSTPATA